MMRAPSIDLRSIRGHHARFFKRSKSESCTGSLIWFETIYNITHNQYIWQQLNLYLKGYFKYKKVQNDIYIMMIGLNLFSTGIWSTQEEFCSGGDADGRKMPLKAAIKPLSGAEE
jgi:hypothetical protein